jgi:hypothetical protein
MKEMMDFHQRATRVLQDVISTTLQDAKAQDIFASPDFLIQIGLLFGLLIVIDVVKRTKGSMSNDLSIYKRTLNFVTSDVESKERLNDELMECQRLSLFIGQQDHFLKFATTLFKDQELLANEFLQELMVTCTYLLEGNGFVLQKDKDRLCIVSYWC